MKIHFLLSRTTLASWESTGTKRAEPVPGGKNCSFQKTNRTIKKDPKNEHLENVLKNDGMISKRTERNRNCFKKTVKIVKMRSYFQEHRSKLGSHFKSGMCFQFRFSLYVVN